MILARELEGSPDLLVAVHPTRGLDIGATRFVHDTMIEARDKGCGVLLISADFDEILEVSDRIVVMLSLIHISSAAKAAVGTIVSIIQRTRNADKIRFFITSPPFIFQ